MTSGVSVSVEFHITRLISVYSVIVGLNLHYGVKKWCCEVKKEQRDNLITKVL